PAMAAVPARRAGSGAAARRGAAGPRLTPKSPGIIENHAAALAAAACRKEEGIMSIKVGDRMPEGKFTVMGANGPEALTTDQLFAGQKVVLVSVPGAFTPTCSAKHLP